MTRSKSSLAVQPAGWPARHDNTRLKKKKKKTQKATLAAESQMPAIRIFSFPFSAFTFFTRQSVCLSPICSKPPRDCPVQCPRLLCPDSFTIYLAPGIWASRSECWGFERRDLSAEDLSFAFGILHSCCWRPLVAGTPPTWTTAHPWWSIGSLEGAVNQARQIRRNLRRPDRFSDPTIQAQSILLYLMSSVTSSAWPVGWDGAGEQRAVASE